MAAAIKLTRYRNMRVCKLELQTYMSKLLTASPCSVNIFIIKPKKICFERCRSVVGGNWINSAVH